MQELKRDIHGLIAARTNFNLADIVDYGGKTFLSDDVAIMLIQEAREAFRYLNMFVECLFFLYLFLS